MLGVVASVCTWLKVWTVSNFAQQLPKFWRNLMQQGVQTDAACNIPQMLRSFARGFKAARKGKSKQGFDLAKLNPTASFTF